MRAIVDANVVSIVFGAGKNKSNNRPDAAREFLKHISSDGPVLVIGGRLKEELFKLERFRIWYDEASKSGRVRNVSDTDVDKEEAKLDSSADCQSNLKFWTILLLFSLLFCVYSRGYRRLGTSRTGFL